METDSSESLQRLYDYRSTLINALLAENTRRGYNYDWGAFTRWCDETGGCPLPAETETISLYVTHLLAGERKISTVERAVATIARMHRAHSLESPAMQEVRTILRGARRVRLEQPRQVLPLSLENLRDISMRLNGKPRGIRNRAILVVGFTSALRSASLVRLNVDDVEFTPRGIVLRIRCEKQDQEGRGRWIGLPHGKREETCPVRCLTEWMQVRGWKPGPLFTRLDRPGLLRLDSERICKIVQKAVKAIGLDPHLYGSHSLRAGFITEAGEAGASELLIASQSGHKSMDVLRRYFRRQDVFKANACSVLDL